MYFSKKWMKAMRLTKLNIGARLGLGFAVVLAFAVVITVIGIWQLHSVGKATQQMMQEPLTKERLISDWNSNVSVAVARTTAIAKSSDASLVQFLAADAAATTKSTANVLKQIEPLISEPAEREIRTGSCRCARPISPAATRSASSRPTAWPKRLSPR